MDEDVTISRTRGRPFGHRLSEETKDKIRNKRMGTHHSKETRDKISKSLIEYFKSRDSLAASIEHEYSYVSDEAAEWVYDNRDAIDDTEHVLTEKRLSYLKQIELSFGNDIEHFFGHSATPEFLLILKEEIIERLGKDKLQELCSLI
jgi:hypothetical protein